MSNSISFTIKDVCLALGGVSRSRVHSWTKLPPFSRMETFERSARRFTSADLLTFAVIQSLEDEYCLRNRLLSRFSPYIHQYLSIPRNSELTELVFLRLRDGMITFIDNAQEAGFLIDITRERARINSYLGVTTSQWQLPLMTSIGAQGK